ncbi:hypothetical protein SBA5_830011 [Candidatus Sulfotelmatomonas gaucii]|uniref:Uncharacterized protein n=1 Tax=Candidatus Sulfuritelmatomonas gaucii TaxID=2043161 RepID=A0A2N9M6Q5_9BACT|nr:hypothetical protein SBA5_830011 [Candidatus Sulfotelmatomonas gaucii]
MDYAGALTDFIDSRSPDKII